MNKQQKKALQARLSTIEKIKTMDADTLTETEQNILLMNFDTKSDRDTLLDAIAEAREQLPNRYDLMAECSEMKDESGGVET